MLNSPSLTRDVTCTVTLLGQKNMRRQCQMNTLGFFPMQYCVESLGQHCTRLLPVECCPKRIKTTLSRIFSWAVLSGASRKTLSRVFPLRCCPKSILTTLNRIFFLCNVVWNLLGNIAQGFYLCNVGSWLTGTFLSKITYKTMCPSSYGNIAYEYCILNVFQIVWDNIAQENRPHSHLFAGQ